MSLEERFRAKVDTSGGPDACWLWTAATNEHGYGVIRPEGRRSGPTLKAHRVAAQLAGMSIEGVGVLHRCDNPPCCNPAHLFVGTPADNAADREAKGRGHRGSRTGTSRLTERQVIEIRQRLANGEQGRTLAKKFGVSPATITYVKRRGWTHV